MKGIGLFDKMKRIIYFALCTFPLLIDGKTGVRRIKRILNGIPIPTLQMYDLRFVVSLRSAWGCSTKVRNWSDCVTFNHCSGSLITSEFVLTACHCSTWEDMDNEGNWGKQSWKPYHPVYNALLVKAGTSHNNVDIGSEGEQIRHITAFLPHSLCNFAESRIGTLEIVSHDVALVLTTDPFQMTKFVQVANKSPSSYLEFELKKIIRRGLVCLWVGFGDYTPIKDDAYEANVLRYSFRAASCTKTCTEFSFCNFCSVGIGAYVPFMEFGDAGCPVLCEKKLVAVHEYSVSHTHLNITHQSDVPLACIKEYITPQYLNGLKKLANSKKSEFSIIPYGAFM